MKLHLVHQSSDGTLAVVSFLFNLSSTDNTALNPLLNAAVYDSVINS
jgi:carbonic anhydrase